MTQRGRVKKNTINSSKHRPRCHSRKQNALCTLSGILDRENMVMARWVERQKARTLKSSGLKESIRTFCDNDNSSCWEELRNNVSKEDYTPAPIRVHRIPKDNGEEREIFIRDNPVDRLVERMIYLKISPILEKTLSKAAYAYRPGISMGQMITEIQRDRGENFNYCIKADMSKFFNTVDQTILKEELQRVLHPDTGAYKLLSKFITSRCMDSKTGSVYTMKQGVAQGGTLAPLLANFYCNPLDQVMESVQNIRYYRYADDILIVSKDVQEAEKAYSILLEELDKRKLKINEDKLEKGSLTGTDILGIHFAENNSLTIPEGRLRKKIKAINSTEDLSERVSKWIGLLQHYKHIDTGMLKNCRIPTIIREECSEERAEELLNYLQEVSTSHSEQTRRIDEMGEERSSVTHGTRVPYVTEAWDLSADVYSTAVR